MRDTTDSATPQAWAGSEGNPQGADYDAWILGLIAQDVSGHHQEWVAERRAELDRRRQSSARPTSKASTEKAPKRPWRTAKGPAKSSEPKRDERDGEMKALLARAVTETKAST